MTIGKTACIAAIAAITGSVLAGCSSGSMPGQVPPSQASVSPSAVAAPTVTSSAAPDDTDARVQAVAKHIVESGYSEKEATTYAESAGMTTRVVQRDGEMYAATMDFRTDRINLVITDGVVTDATVG